MGPEQLKVLRLVADGVISPAEGDHLLRILEVVAEVEPEVSLEETEVKAEPTPAPAPPPVEAIEPPPVEIIAEQPAGSLKSGWVRQWLSALGIGQLQNS